MEKIDLTINELLKDCIESDEAMEEAIKRLESASSILFDNEKTYRDYRIIAGPKEIDKTRSSFYELRNGILSILKHCPNRFNFWFNALEKIQYK